MKKLSEKEENHRKQIEAAAKTKPEKDEQKQKQTKVV